MAAPTLPLVLRQVTEASDETINVVVPHLFVRVYLKFLLANGKTAEFVRLYRPDLHYQSSSSFPSSLTVPYYESCAPPEPMPPPPPPPPQCQSNQITVNGTCYTCSLGVVAGTNQCQCASDQVQESNGTCRSCGPNTVAVNGRCMCKTGYSYWNGLCTSDADCDPCVREFKSCQEDALTGPDKKQCWDVYKGCRNNCGL
jgi:hypothetical protein